MGPGEHGELLHPNGFDKICDLLKEGNSSNPLQVRLSKPVSQIATTTSGATVVAGGETFQADAVVVTVPLGVLKESQLQFSPALPQAKMEAISGIGFGSYNKFFMYWDEQWWKDTGYFGSVERERKSYLTNWLNVAPLSGEKKALCGISVGTGAEFAETLTDDQVKRNAMDILREMNDEGLLHKDGESDVPEPSQVLTVRWGL